ncbi:MAG: sugar ABC transporter substrate-binding protein [bacterium]|nr:sugar ABC transporter substrate-binding protein [bacterium]
MKKVINILLAVILMMNLVGCGNEPQISTDTEQSTDTATESGLKIGMVYGLLSEEFAVDLQTGIRKACEDAGVELVECDYNFDYSKGNDYIDNLITMQVDGIILWPFDADVFTGNIDKARAAGIPVITVDCTANTEVDCFVAADSVLGGKLAAEYMVKNQGETGKTLIITPAPGMSSLEQRDKGYYEVLEQYPGIEVVEQLDAGTNARAGYAQTVENALNANPDITSILANCGDVALAALSVVEMYPEKFGDVKIYGFDASAEQMEAMKQNRQIEATVAQYPIMIGRLAVENMVKKINGEEIDKEVMAEVGLVTKESAESFEAKE